MELLPEEVWTMLSRFDLPRRWKKFLLKPWTLSGRSRDGALLPVDRLDGRRANDMLSKVCSHEGRSPFVDRIEDDRDDGVRWMLAWFK
jgi:hypothetical protein